MKLTFSRKSTLLIALALLCGSLSASASTYRCTPGTLRQIISETWLYKISDLKLTGTMNYRDLRTIREMASCYEEDGTRYNGSLVNLDLSEVKYDGRDNKTFYGYDSNKKSYLMNNLNGGCTFGFLYNIQSITLPSGTTAIDNYAFYGCSRIMTLEIPAKVTKIGYKAFADCYGLLQLTVNATTPPTLYDYFEDDTFSGMNMDRCYLYVPQGSAKLYRNAKGWKNFKYIYEIGAGVDDVAVDEAVEVARYTIDGKPLSEPANGVNIVKYSDGSVRKVMVRK